MPAVRPVLIAALLAAASASEAMAGGVSVQMDNVAVVAFKEPVATLYLGNPSIAELTLIDSRHAFVLGKRFGITNLIALSPDKSVIVNEPVTVTSRGWGSVTIYRGADSYNYTCSKQHCETRPVPGDPVPYFDNTEHAAGEHDDTATKAAIPSAPSQGSH